MSTAVADVVYPDSDGEPMSDNTLQYDWISTVKGGLDIVFRDDPAVFVAANNLIYPVEGDPKTRLAPDIYVAFGRPKGRRGSYQVWAEGGVFPQVVFEVLSPGNRAGEMARKLLAYEEFGAEEYYVIDPDRDAVTLHLRGLDGEFEAARDAVGFTSPRLGARFDRANGELLVYGPDGRQFRPIVEVDAERQAHAERADREAAARAAAEANADREAARADREAARAAELLALLKAAGITPPGGTP